MRGSRSSSRDLFSGTYPASSCNVLTLHVWTLQRKRFSSMLREMRGYVGIYRYIEPDWKNFMYDQLLDIQDLADRLKIPTKTIRNKLSDGTWPIRPVRIGR